MNSHDSGGFAHYWLGDVVVIETSGTVDMLTAPELTEAIHVAVGKHPAAVIVDLSAATFLALVGINQLLVAHRNSDPTTRFGVVAEGPVTARPFELTGVDAILPVYRTLDDALEQVAS